MNGLVFLLLHTSGKMAPSVYLTARTINVNDDTGADGSTRGRPGPRQHLHTPEALCLSSCTSSSTHHRLYIYLYRRDEDIKAVRAMCVWVDHYRQKHCSCTYYTEIDNEGRSKKKKMMKKSMRGRSKGVLFIRRQENIHTLVHTCIYKCIGNRPNVFRRCAGHFSP